jgi:hypothetical protein
MSGGSEADVRGQLGGRDPWWLDVKDAKGMGDPGWSDVNEQAGVHWRPAEPGGRRVAVR